VGESLSDLLAQKRSDRIQKWLSPPDPSTNYNKALQQCHEGTGLWFLGCDSFEHWRITPNSFLWLHGLPGCGKTVLSSTIIQSLHEGITAGQLVLYFYFDFNDTGKQSLEDMARTFISQIYLQHGDLENHLHSLFTACRSGGQQPSPESMLRILEAMLTGVNEPIIVLDALDESRTREAVLIWTETLLELGCPKLHVLVTSRKEADIESMMVKRRAQQEMLAIKSCEIDDDIRIYVQGRLLHDNDMSRWKSRPDIQEEIVTKLMEKADGM
jgi:Cdc6-like AAA superfamily ATPase